MGKEPKNLFDHIADHPKLAAFIACVAFAATFSPRVSGGAMWACLVIAWIFGSAMIIGLPKLRTHRFRLFWYFPLVLVVGIGLFVYGEWLRGNPSPLSVSIEWPQPNPISSEAQLSSKQLNAKALIGGKKVDGTYVYNPTFGATLPVGTQTLDVTFTPSDTSQYLSASKTVPLLVQPPEVHQLPLQGGPSGTSPHRISPPAPQPPSDSDLTRHLLSKEEQESFESPLLAQTEPRNTIILNCPADEERDCAYALQFVDYFKGAGFTVDGNMVHRITLQAPYWGVVLGEHIAKDPDPNQPGGGFMWMMITPTRMSVEKAFANIHTGTMDVHGSQVPANTLEVYFGPEPPIQDAKSALQKSIEEVEKFEQGRKYVEALKKKNQSIPTPPQ